MYSQFWGFREKPFKQVPNPEFLFLSSTHEEALAHLSYILSEGDGFLMITGEVGTGKSTLCRAFLKDIDPDVVCAYIFNPRLDALQLLKSINAEFGIANDANTTHELSESLNSFLIEQRAAQKKVLIIIDEAQNLPVESLEQVRLLSNLETTQQKLLQIVLVGQPELARMIDSFELRQLGQRINLSSHLLPLSSQETQQYIQHRINVASLKPQMPFKKGALRSIYTFSGGVPRLINTACDRMLLAAYLNNQSEISTTLAGEIIDELTRRGRVPQSVFPWGKVAISAAAVAVAVCAVVLFFTKDRWVGFLTDRPSKPELAAENEVTPPKTPVATADPADSSPPVAPQDEIETAEAGDTEAIVGVSPGAMPLDELLAAIAPYDTRRMAAEAVLQQWELEPEGDMVLTGIDDWTYFMLIAERHGLSVHTVEGDLSELAVLNLPAIIGVIPRGGDAPLYATVIGRNDGRYLLTAHGLDSPAQVGDETLLAHWDGVALIPWKNYLGYHGVIPGGAPDAAVILLKQLLWEIGYSQLVINNRFDAETRNAIMEIQAKHGLEVDGMVGNMTKIVLYNEKKDLPIPRLRE
jgi:general secretion pathway protein A